MGGEDGSVGPVTVLAEEVSSVVNSENEMVRSTTEIESIDASLSHHAGARSMTVEAGSSRPDDEDTSPVKRAVLELLEIAEWRGIDLYKWFELKEEVTELHRALTGLGLGLATGQPAEEPAIKQALQVISMAREDAVAILSSELAAREKVDDVDSVVSHAAAAEDNQEKEEASSFNSRTKNTAWRPDDFQRHGFGDLGITNTTIQSEDEATPRIFNQSGPQVITAFASASSTIEDKGNASPLKDLESNEFMTRNNRNKNKNDEAQEQNAFRDIDPSQSATILKMNPPADSTFLFRQQVTTWSRAEALAGFGRAVSLCRGDGGQALGAALAMLRRELLKSDTHKEDDLLNARLSAKQAANAFQKHGIQINLSEMSALLAHLDPEARRSRRYGISARFGPLRAYCFGLRGELASARRSVWSVSKISRNTRRKQNVSTRLRTVERRAHLEQDELQQAPEDTYLLGMSTPQRKKETSKTWEAWVAAQAKRRRDDRRREFRRALAGLSHSLNSTELNQSLTKYQVLSAEMLDAAINMFVERYAQSHDCRFDALKLAAAAATGIDSSESMEQEARTRKRRALYESEASEAKVTRELWKDFQRIHGLKNKQNTSTTTFIDFVQGLIATHAKQKEFVDEWYKKKQRLAKLSALDAKKAAPAPVVESELRNLCARLDRRVGDVQRPSRLGVDIDRRLRTLLKSKQKIITKADIYSSFGTNTAFSLLADPRVSKQALDLTDLETRDAIKSRRSQQEDNEERTEREFVFGEYADTADAEYAADQLFEAKRRENRAHFRAWKRDKAKIAAKEKSRITNQLAILEPKLTQAKKDAKRALTRWNKAQRLVEKRRSQYVNSQRKAKEAAALNTSTTEDEDCAQATNGHAQTTTQDTTVMLAVNRLEQALIIHHRRKAEALQVTRRWRDLEKRIHSLHKKTTATA